MQFRVESRQQCRPRRRNANFHAQPEKFRDNWRLAEKGWLRVMIGIDEPPSMAERYGRATKSSHLRVGRWRDRCDVDYLIAAGSLEDTLGVKLYRLRGEYDAARSDLRRAATVAVYTAAQIAAAEAIAAAAVKAWRPPARWPRAAADEPARMRICQASCGRTEHLLALINLKSLAAAKKAFGNFAMAMNTTRWSMTQVAVLAIAGKVLEVWLDPSCHECAGRGFNGGEHRGQQKISCRWCGATGERRVTLGEAPEQKRFAAMLLDQLLERLNSVDEAMIQKLSRNALEGAQ